MHCYRRTQGERSPNILDVLHVSLRITVRCEGRLPGDQLQPPSGRCGSTAISGDWLLQASALSAPI
jgi:hypothetical protein